MLFFAALVWISLCVAIGVGAHARGRGGPEFFGLSLLLSPLVGFVLLILLPVKRRPEREMARSAKAACPACGGSVRTDSVRCRHCDAELPAMARYRSGG